MVDQEKLKNLATKAVAASGFLTTPQTAMRDLLIEFFNQAYTQFVNDNYISRTIEI